MTAPLDQRLKSKLLEYLGITWFTLHDSVKKDIEVMPDLIGASAAAKALSYYLLHYEELSLDLKLADFMRFYASHHAESKSQWSQDIWVMYESQDFANKCYLEIGGADGFTHSNTLALEAHHGWSGTLVEPERHQFKILQIARRNNKLLNNALSPSGNFETATLRSVGQLSSLKGFESNDVHFHHRMRSRRFQRINAISLQSILADTKYDYFSFDIEGAELSVLQTVNWNQVFKPELLTIEHNSRNNEKKALLELLTSLGYVPCFFEHDWLLHGDIWLKLAR